MFRMETRTFYKLSTAIKTAVGNGLYKSEHNFTRVAHDQTVVANNYHGGLLYGELKLALMLHRLAGSSYLDLCSLFCVVSTSTHDVLHEAIE